MTKDVFFFGGGVGNLDTTFVALIPVDVRELEVKNFRLISLVGSI